MGVRSALGLTSALGLGLLGCAGEPHAPRIPAADFVLRGGSVFSAGDSDTLSQALALTGDRIVFVGSDADAAAHIGRKTRVIELAGRFVMPGIVDGHVHPLSGGAMLESCSLAYLPLTRTELKERVAACLAAETDAGAGDWLEVRQWQAQEIVPPGAKLTKRTLDQIETPRPILVRSADGHIALASSRALERAGILAETPDPPNGKLGRDASGAPNGLLFDGAIELVESMIPPPSLAQQEHQLGAATRHLAAVGVTTFLAAAVGVEQLPVYTALAERGELLQRAHLALVVTPAVEHSPEAVVARLRGAREGNPAQGVAIDTAKIFLDGVMEAPAQTSALLEPYLGTDGKRGELYAEPGELAALVTALDADGWRVHFHATGDRAVRAALDALAAAREKNGARGVRHAIAHLELVDPADVPRFAELGGVALFSPQWALRQAFTMQMLEPYLGPERMARLYPIHSLLAAGAHVSFGSDWPVDPVDRLYAIETAVTRERANEVLGQPGKLAPDQAITLAQALRAYTAGSAYQLGREQELGSLAPGKLADFVVLDRNPFAGPPSAISDAKVVATWVGGKPTYQAPDAHQAD